MVSIIKMAVTNYYVIGLRGTGIAHVLRIIIKT